MPKGVYIRTENHMAILRSSAAGKLKGFRHSVIARKNMSEGLKRRFATNPVSEETKLKMSKSHKGISNNWLGRKHSAETREKMKISNKGKSASGWKMTNEQRMRVAIGHAENLPVGTFGPYKGIYFRSRWELQVAENLDKLGLYWVYEPHYFTLPSGKTYTPDFLVLGKYIEVKGCFRVKNVMKMNEFVSLGNELFVIDGRNLHNSSLYFSCPWEVRS